MGKFSDALNKAQTTRVNPKPGAGQASAPEDGEKDERREFRRSKCFALGHAVISYPNGDAIIGPCTILNYSNKGLLFEFEHGSLREVVRTHEAKAKVRLAASPGREPLINVEGKVVRSQVLGRIQIAVQFKEPIHGLSEKFNFMLAS